MSLSDSPPTKRMRLSSPTFDDQVADLSQDDIDAFDSLDAQLSQSIPVRQSDEDPFRSGQATRIHAPFMSASAFELSDEPEPHDEAPEVDVAAWFNPDSSNSCVGFSAATTAFPVFQRPSAKGENAKSLFIPSPEPHDEAPEVDVAAWFNPDSSNACVGFSAATTAFPVFQRPSAKGENAKSLFIPSAAALREAEEKRKKWEEEAPPPDQLPTHDEPDLRPSSQIMSPPRAAFSSARNAYSSGQAPETPTPPSLFRSANTELQSLGTKRQTKAFKSPLISALPPMPSHRQVSTPSISSPLRGYHSSATVPFQSTPVVSPLRPSSVVNHVAAQKPLGFTPRHGTAAMKSKFVTPFKTLVKSATPRASVLENMKLPPTPSNPRASISRVYPPSVSSSHRPSKRNSDGRIFDLTPPPGRQTLATSGLRPQAYSAKQLEDMGINFKELSQVNPRTTPFYAFTTLSRSLPISPDPSSPLVLGRLAALEELHEKGCILAKQAWVDNHWPLVLWKLAGMVTLDPTSESDPLRKRWCWPEVIRQLMYRYERDLNSSSRPPLRLITIRDASAESPMVLCISDIIWPAGGTGEAIAAVQSHPELEVTDGWYRLRARVDAPLARAVRKGRIQIGRKIAVAGAKLSAERKEGSEILEAYNSNVLLLTGNSTHMAPWHTKLGFQRGPFIATLNSLTADGGNVAVMMLRVIKAYPVAYMEFVEDDDGQKQRVGPHDAKEELKLSTQWKTKRELHASSVWSEYEKRRDRLLDFAERLEQRAGPKFRSMYDDGPPDKIYDIYDALQEDIKATQSVISTISQEDAGWLARHIRERAVQERDVVSKEIEQELESTCPPRDVKVFCVVVVNDARTYKYPSTRTAQVTVWEVPGVSVSEGCTQNPFVPGQWYLVTNLVPTQASAWMDRSPGGEVYLSTRKNSKWTLVK
ncbi:hypothetical protein L210DRAFT_3757880 [Boletus edulis BED1]|uniref:BRCA2 OB1 domain-containing protein n=1 Tax=Boletus edulis BED1 TaxID=1328754 RepID=A0AAD4C1Q3_BOLED|nr:hypothetical protein L210DRAFT_3757880 [Boletus edulis BED1]